MNDFKRVVEWSPAYNRKAEGYGIHGMEVRFVLKGEKGAVQFLLSTNWQHSTTRAENPSGHHSTYQSGEIMCLNKPNPSDIGYHARKPQYNGQSVQVEKCAYLGDAPCYYDGSSLNAQRYFDIFTDEGEEALWKALEDYYVRRFDEEAPTTFNEAPMGELLGALFGTPD